jgi:hypothetical protein
VFLVGTPVFKTGVGRYPSQVGSIPIRLRYPFGLRKPAGRFLSDRRAVRLITRRALRAP